MFLIGSLLAVAMAADAPQLRQHMPRTSGAVDSHVLVGRARCGETTWLLTDAPALVRIATAERRIVTAPIRGLDRDDRPFGLACLRGDLWTLGGFRGLLRLSPDAIVVSRVKLRQPRLSVFGTEDSLLFLQLPTSAGMPLLTRASPADANRQTPWPGVISAEASTAQAAISSALVTCGLAFRQHLPCWAASDARISIADGTASHTTFLAPRFLGTLAIDPTTPIWDVALTSPVDGWVLTSTVAGPAGRRAGGRLTRVGPRGDDMGHLDLAPRARVILSATDRSALVLTATGTLLEVTP